MPDLVQVAERGHPSTGVPVVCIEAFTTELSSLGYSALVVRQKRATAAAFTSWAVLRRLEVAKDRSSDFRRQRG